MIRHIRRTETVPKESELYALLQRKKERMIKNERDLHRDARKRVAEA